MNKSSKKKFGAIFLALALCLSLVFSLAYFTDREDHAAGATAGNINLVWEDTSKADAHGTEDQDNTKDGVWGDTATPGAIASKIINPGDQFDMGYKLTNTGSKSIDVKQELVLTSDKKMTAGAEEYQLKANGVTLTGTPAADGMSITYTLPEIVLTGSAEADVAADGIEGENAIVGTDGVDYDIYLEFAGSADNDFMNSNVSVSLNVLAKQHRNSDADWTQIATYETVG